MALSAFVRDLQQGQEVARATWNPRKLLSDWQHAFYVDAAEVRVADAGRRSGKTFAFAVLMLDLAITVPGAQIDYAAKSETDARELIYADLERLNYEYALGGHWTKNFLRFANGAAIRLTGAKDPAEAQRRFRGRGKDLIVVDECSLLPWLQEMVQEAIQPALVRGGKNGRLILGGTPSEVEGVGYWEEVRAGKFPKWSIHVATIFDNPTIANPQGFLETRAAELGGWKSPVFQREYLRNNKMGPGADSLLVYRWSKELNHPTGYSARTVKNEAGQGTVFDYRLRGKWTYLLACDLGHVRDASSIFVAGICDAAPGKAWLVEEFLFSKRPKQDVLAREVNARIARYKTAINLCDEGALGAQSADWLRAPPYNVPLQAAEKTHPLASSDSLNASLLAGELQIPAESQTAKDLARLRWNAEKLKKGKREMAKMPHSDLEPPLRYLGPHLISLLRFIKAPPARKTPAQLEDEEDERERREAANQPKWYGTQPRKKRRPF